MSKNQGLSAEEKVKLVRRCLAGEMSVSEAGRQAGVHHKSIQRWIDQYEAEGAEGFFHKTEIGYIAPKQRSRLSGIICLTQEVCKIFAKSTKYGVIPNSESG